MNIHMLLPLRKGGQTTATQGPAHAPTVPRQLHSRPPPLYWRPKPSSSTMTMAKEMGYSMSTRMPSQTVCTFF
jgi:hypothetical protein